MTQRIDEVIIDALVRHMAMSDPYCRFEVGDETNPLNLILLRQELLASDDP